MIYPLKGNFGGKMSVLLSDLSRKEKAVTRREDIIAVLISIS